MKRFKPETTEPYSTPRKAVLEEMGLPSSSDLLVHAADQIDHWCKELADKTELSDEQKAGLRAARRDAPVAIGALHDLIIDRLMTREQKEDTLFLLAKLIDDCIEIGCYGVLDREAGLRSHAVLSGAKSGGGVRGEQIAQEADDTWRSYAETWVIAERTASRHLTNEELASRLGDELSKRGVDRGSETLRKFVSNLKAKLPSRVPLPRKSRLRKR